MELQITQSERSWTEMVVLTSDQNGFEAHQVELCRLIIALDKFVKAWLLIDDTTGHDI